MSKFLTNFKPQLHGFHFSNQFVNVVFDNFLGSWTTYGRCGGMAYAALDYYYSGIPIPMHKSSDFPNGKVPGDGSDDLGKYIYDRLMDSFDWYNGEKFILWTEKLDHSTWIWGDGVTKLTKDEEFPKLCNQIVNGPLVIGLIAASSIGDIGKNHQVVAYGYENDTSSGKKTVYVYDNNNPDLEMILTSEANQSHFYLRYASSGTVCQEYRGFFVEDYSAKTPWYKDIIMTEGLSLSKPYPAIGDELECKYKVKNVGKYQSSISSLGISVTGPSGVDLSSEFATDGNSAPIKPGEERGYIKKCDYFGTVYGTYILAPCYNFKTNSGTSYSVNNIPGSREVKLNVNYLSQSILNKPPYVSSVCVVKALPGLTPIGFGAFDNTNVPTGKKSKVKYQATWIYDSPGKYKLDVSTPATPISASDNLYVFVDFTTANFWGNTATPNQMLVANLKLTGTTPDNVALNMPVTLVQGTDSYSGVFYWGAFKPVNTWQKSYNITLEIDGKDNAAHNKTRNPIGDILDKNPGTEVSIDMSKPPVYPFINYEPGTDINHVISIGCKTASLMPDALEVNDSFDTATKRIMAMPALGAVSKLEFDNLNLHNEKDIDYFNIQFQSQASDDSCALDKPSTSTFSSKLGLRVTHYPPALIINVTNYEDKCTNLDIYQSDSNGRKLFQSYINEGQIIIYNPAKKFSDKKFYLVVKNSNYAEQGALKYDISFTYAPPHEVFSNSGGWDITFDSELYVILKKLYDKIDLPRPPEEVLNSIIDDSKLPQISANDKTSHSIFGIIIDDYKGFITKYQTALQSIKAEDLGGKITQNDLDGIRAGELSNLSRFAKGKALTDISGRLQTESGAIISKLGSLGINFKAAESEVIEKGTTINRVPK